MSDYSLVVFDMAGTTIVDNGNVADAFLQSFREQGMELAAEEAQKVMGWRKTDAIRMLLEKFYPARLEENSIINIIHDRFTRLMVSYYEQAPELQPQPYAEELFDLLHKQGIRVALNTGFVKEVTHTILKRLQWESSPLVDFVISSDEVPAGRPAPDMIRTLMAKAAVTDPARVVKVGDTEVDIEEGRQASCGLVVAVTTGAYSRNSLEPFKPDFIIDSLAGLPALMGVS